MREYAVRPQVLNMQCGRLVAPSRAAARSSPDRNRSYAALLVGHVNLSFSSMTVPPDAQSLATTTLRLRNASQLSRERPG